MKAKELKALVAAAHSECPECGRLRMTLENERRGWQLCLDYAEMKIERLERELRQAAARTPIAVSVA